MLTGINRGTFVLVLLLERLLLHLVLLLLRNLLAVLRVFVLVRRVLLLHLRLVGDVRVVRFLNEDLYHYSHEKH